jgi:hypothetical protein
MTYGANMDEIEGSLGFCSGLTDWISVLILTMVRREEEGHTLSERLRCLRRSQLQLSWLEILLVSEIEAEAELVDSANELDELARWYGRYRGAEGSKEGERERETRVRGIAGIVKYSASIGRKSSCLA